MCEAVGAYFCVAGLRGVLSLRGGALSVLHLRVILMMKGSGALP